VRLKGCGHLAFVTQPERVAAAVSRFLDKGECEAAADGWQAEIE